MRAINLLRNIAIIAHVDHGKTTLVDKLLVQSGTIVGRQGQTERMMDSNDLERERGITILAKNTALRWRDYFINIVDTPGHADFGGEVERVLSMVDSVLILVDAVDGPMPQTRFVTQKALAFGYRPIVVINKVDRNGARPDWVLDQTFELFDRLGATEAQLDFPVVYCSALKGYAMLDMTHPAEDMTPLFQAIVDHVPPPKVDFNGPFQMQISSLDYNSYLGLIGIGRITRGHVKANTPVAIVDRHGEKRQGRVLQIFGFLGLERLDVPEAQAGDIVAITGIEDLNISDTLCDPKNIAALPPLAVDEPTVSVTFQVNDSPYAGRDGKYVTSRKIRERLEQELKHNVALRVEDTADTDKFMVSGRGELHLSILIENMRRQGYELGVSRPQVIIREENGVKLEPYEQLTLDVEDRHQGTVMERIAQRGGEIKNMQPDGQGRIRLDYVIPSRGLMGFRTEFLTATSGSGLLYHVFDKYAPIKKGDYGQRTNGVLIANGAGKALAYSLFNLQERGRLFIKHGDEVYEGMVIGIHSRDNDLVVNPLKGKQLTNIRAAGCDENIVLTPPINLSLEQALEFISNDELVEVTPNFIRLRKIRLKEHERKRQTKDTKN